MAVVAISDSVRRIDQAEATTNWTKIGSSLAQEPDFVYQGSFAVSSKIGTTAGGHYVDVSTAIGAVLDMTAGDDKVHMGKRLWSNYAVLTSNPAAIVRIGSSSGNYYEWYLADDGTQGDIDYPIRGGWLITPIDVNVTAWYDAVVGTPVLTSIDYIATLGDFTAASKSENVVTDSVDTGDGLFLVGGDTAPAGTWQDFIDDDEGAPTAGRFGFFSTVEGVIYVFGQHWIGRTSAAASTLTVFSDELQTLVFPGGRVAAGWNAIKLDLGTASTDIDFTAITHIGRGRSRIKRYFDTEFEVDGTNEELDITAHGFSTGDAVLYSNEGGGQSIGLTSGNEYFVEVMTVDSIALHSGTGTGRQSAYTAGTPVGLTASGAGNGEEHSLTRQPDTRPDLTATGTSGAFNATSCLFQSFRNFDLTSVCLLDTCTLIECQKVDLTTASGGQLDGCIITDPTTVWGEAFIVADTLVNIDNCEFDQGPDGGHAIEIDTAGSYAFAGNLFTGYWTDDDDNTGGVAFNAQNDVDGTNDEIDIAAHPFTTGDPIYYSDEGGTQIAGLTDQAKYYVRSVTAGSISLHYTLYGAVNNQNKIGLTAGSDETHKLYSANATIYNSSGGSVTINVSPGSDTPSIRNSAGSTTTVNNTITISVTNVIGGSQVRVEGASSGLVLNLEAVPSSRVWSEKLEATGYDETWSQGETTSGSATIDSDKSTSGISGLPDGDWEDLCLEVVLTAAAENAYVQNNFGAAEDPVWFHIEGILDAESLTTSTGNAFARGMDSSDNILWELFWYQNASDELRIRANIRHDDTDNFFESDFIISLDTRYIIEVKWDDTGNTWEWRAGGPYTRNVATQDSGSLTSTRQFQRLRIGTTSAGAAATYYLDIIELDDSTWVKEAPGLATVSVSDFNYAGDEAATIKVRRASWLPKYKPWNGGGTILATGMSVQAAQIVDEVAAP
jgi:hypothetical protein